MITVLELRQNPYSKSNGIDMYCNALRNLFAGDDGITILPVENYPMVKGRILKERYAKGVLGSLMHNESIDVVHINGVASYSVIQSFWQAKKAGKKIVYTAHWHPFEYMNHPFLARLFFNCLLRPLVRRFADAVVTINKEDTAYFKRFHKRVVQIPHWIDSASLKSISVEKDPNMVLFVGRFNDKNKGAEHLCHLPEGRYNIHCVGPCDGGLRSDMTNHVNIPFEDLCALYAKASLLVVPSRYEAFSYATLEALTYGTPVLLSERVRIVDYLDGVEGVDTFKYQNYQEFCDKVTSGVKSHVDTKSVNAIFNESHVKDAYRNLFLSLFE